jgi:carbon monoxide dehydrogenase subunit G
VIEIKNDFQVPAEPTTVYDFLLKLEEVGGCIPGGTVGPAGDDGAHPAEIVVKLGPMRFNYRGTVRLEDRADLERRATLLADVREARGQGSARARMEMAVDAEHNGARVVTRTEVELSGRAASMGRGVIDDVAARMVDDMAACVTERLGNSERLGDSAPAEAAAVPQQKPIRGFRLMLRILWSKLFRRS